MIGIEDKKEVLPQPTTDIPSIQKPDIKKSEAEKELGRVVNLLEQRKRQKSNNYDYKGPGSGSSEYWASYGKKEQKQSSSTYKSKEPSLWKSVKEYVYIVLLLALLALLVYVVYYWISHGVHWKTGLVGVGFCVISIGAILSKL